MINLVLSRWVPASDGHGRYWYEAPYVITIQIIIWSTCMSSQPYYTLKKAS
jgi:hypothetical protein